ncbi:MAG: NADH-quinone oxidoreductase subunit NuoN [Rhodocyclaceae bacterium]|nr:NADH-quinone oxidoreductase subunit NuoN [Rhodocyclaceae bacterium]
MKLEQINVMLALPELLLLGGIFVLMLVELFGNKERSATRLFVGALLLLAIVTAAVIFTARGGVQIGFSRMFVVDPMSAILKTCTLLSVAMLLVYSRTFLVVRKLFSGEFVLLLLFSVLGMMIMVSANHFVSLYLGLEIMSLAIYSLVALNRDSASSTEAAMKYFVLGALASGLLLYGISMIYGATGSLDITVVSGTIIGRETNLALVSFGVVFIIAGLGFKLGVVPFHMWVPDVYQGSVTPVTLLIGSAPKIAAFGFIIRILGDGLAGAYYDWRDMLIILAIASIAAGNIIAIAQTNIKRMLAYSTISHMGFLLLGLIAGNASGYAASMFYVITYALTTLGAFGILLMLSRADFEAGQLDDLKGLNQRSPWLAVLMLFVMMSFAGIPPFVGFFAKLSVLEAVLHAGHAWLVVYAVLMSVIGAFYYLRVVKLMYFDEPVEQLPIVGGQAMRLVIGINAFAVLLLGLLPGTGLMGVCLAAIHRSL